MSTTVKADIGTLNLVCITSLDQDKSIAFYTDLLGFEKRADTAFGDKYRWVEVYPPSGTAGIALAPPPPGKDNAPKETGITLTTSDVDACHAALQAAGVDVDAEVSRMGDPVPPMFWFRDPDGHTLMIVEDNR